MSCLQCALQGVRYSPVASGSDALKGALQTISAVRQTGLTDWGIAQELSKVFDLHFVIAIVVVIVVVSRFSMTTTITTATTTS